jgi:hypothetical protein
MSNWPVDGHVHFHFPELVGPTLDAAAANFRAAGGRSEGLLGGILLTQTSGERVFEFLQTSPAIAGWTFTPAQEPETLIARKGKSSLAVICGRQVRAANGLEVLALGTCEVFADGLPFGEAVEAVRQSGALTVIPWGFGKWLGERGKLVENTLESLGRQVLFVGDNGNRLGLLGQPVMIREAEQRGFCVLPGTDPFPFAGNHRRVGSLGFFAELSPAQSAPWRELRAWLLGQTVSPRLYGRASGPIQFVFNQVGIQVYYRFINRRPA